MESTDENKGDIVLVSSFVRFNTLPNTTAMSRKRVQRGEKILSQGQLQRVSIIFPIQIANLSAKLMYGAPVQKKLEIS